MIIITKNPEGTGAELHRGDRSGFHPGITGQRLRPHPVHEFCALDAAGVAVACQFCWADGMVDGFGLLDSAGTPKESYAAFVGGTRALYAPHVERVPGTVAGFFSSAPRGIILHGTRSTRDYDELREYEAPVRWVRPGAAGLGWNVTVGPDRIAEHLSPRQWGWNAREHSSDYLAIEFAQSRPGAAISDRQVRAAAWWI